MSTASDLLDQGWRRHEAGDPEGAERLYRRATVIDPVDRDAWCLLGMARHDQARYETAVTAYEQALIVEPRFPVALSNLANTLTTMGQAREAEARCREALRLEPDFPTAHTNLAVSLLTLGRTAEATSSFRRAVDLDPEDAGLQANLGAALARQGRSDEALEHAERALRLDPDDAEAHLVRSAVWLSRGDLHRGWREYEWRWRSRQYQAPRYAAPRRRAPVWDGSSLEGRALLVWGEQGVGDEILFAQMVPDLTSRARRVVLECDPRLLPLFARSFPSVEVRHRAPVPPAGGWAHDVDVTCPAGSLAQYLRADPSRFPPRAAYLEPDPDRVERYHRRYDRLGPGPKVGISWRTSSVQVEPGRRRSTSLEGWRPILERKGVVWISLQYGDRRAEIEAARRRFGLQIHHDPEVDPLNDLDAFAAQVAAVDLVVSIDNATAHMAGGLGVPVWTLLPHVADPRWLHSATGTPWYPSMRLFRQARPGHWREVFERVASFSGLSAPAS